MEKDDFLLSRHHFRQLEEAFPLAMLREVPQLATPLHRHDFCECAFVMAGCGVHQSEDHAGIPIRRGDVLVIPQGGRHAYIGAEELDICNLLFDTTRLPPVLLELYSNPVYKRIFLREHDTYGKENFPHFRLEEPVFSELAAMLGYLGGAAGTPGNHCYKLGLFMAILSRLCSVWKTEDGEAATPLNIQRITEYLEQHFRQEIYLDDLCGLTSMSRATLLRHFHAALGVTPMVYLRNLRLRHAAELLLHSDLGLQEIAEMSGFSRMPYFHRAFRSCYGTSPGEYRKN